MILASLPSTLRMLVAYMAAHNKTHEVAVCGGVAPVQHPKRKGNGFGFDDDSDSEEEEEEEEDGNASGGGGGTAAAAAAASVTMTALTSFTAEPLKVGSALGLWDTAQKAIARYNRSPRVTTLVASASAVMGMGSITPIADAVIVVDCDWSSDTHAVAPPATLPASLGGVGGGGGGRARAAESSKRGGKGKKDDGDDETRGTKCTTERTTRRAAAARAAAAAAAAPCANWQRLVGAEQNARGALLAAATAGWRRLAGRTGHASTACGGSGAGRPF